MASIKPLSVARLQAMSRMLQTITDNLGTSPDRVLKNFIEILKNASPQLKLAIAFFTPWALLITAISKYLWVVKGFKTLKSYAASSIYSSVVIPGSHPLNRQVLEFMAQQGLGNNARTLALSTPQAGGTTVSMMVPSGLLHGSDVQYDSLGRRIKGKRSMNPEHEDKEAGALIYTPDVGSFFFWYKFYHMKFEGRRAIEEQIDQRGKTRYTQSQTADTVIISCPTFFAGPKPIQDFLKHIKAAPVKDHSTTIYRSDSANPTIWDSGITRPSRNLNAVTLDARIKDDLVKDVETYLSPATRKYYANRGIPWRRGFLFYGLPGCGKTSFTNALAGHFNLNVYMLSLSNKSINDVGLEILFEQLPARCIVLLEDIDSAGIKRESMRAQKPKRKRRVQNHYDENGYLIEEAEDIMAGGVTLSGLLNVLDGIHSKEGHVTIMTTNSPDSLDPALVRPGRIDRKVLFGYASKEVVGKLFKHIFEKALEEMIEGENAGGEHNISALAEAFASKIPVDKLTPAEVQGYLLVHRADPVLAVEEAAAWAEKTLETRFKGANVETFAGEGKSDHQMSRKADGLSLTPDDIPFTHSGAEDFEDSMNIVQDEGKSSTDPSAGIDWGALEQIAPSTQLQLRGLPTPPMSRQPSDFDVRHDRRAMALALMNASAKAKSMTKAKSMGA